MLIPQFSIRTLFALTALAAVVAWVLSQAVYGALWAQCAAWTIVFAACLLAVHGIFFLFSWSLGQTLGVIVRPPKRVASPFLAATQAPTGTSPFGTQTSPDPPLGSTP